MPTCKFTQKKSFTHPRSCILPSFPRNASRLLLRKSLWKCASTISFRKYGQLPSYWIWALTFSWVQFLSNKLKLFVSCSINITRTSFYLLCALTCTFFIKTFIMFSIMVIIIFYFDICIKFSISTIISTMKKW